MEAVDRSEGRTHRIAVSAYIVREGKFLLLRRVNPPCVWAPPGGRLRIDEDPAEGVRREIMEECRAEIRVLAPVDVWYGDFGRGIFLSIDYLSEFQGGTIRLSDEHSDFCWASVDELRSGKVALGGGTAAFSVGEFEKAWRLYGHWASRHTL